MKNIKKIYMIVFAAVILMSCKTLSPEVIEIVDLFFDVGCVIARAEIPDELRDRLCQVPKKYQARSHDAAATVRMEKRAYAAEQIKAQRENLDGGIEP